MLKITLTLHENKCYIQETKRKLEHCKKKYEFFTIDE